MTEYVNSIQLLLTVDSNAFLNTKQKLNNRLCYRKFVDVYSKHCFNFNQNLYAFHKLWVFVNICETLNTVSEHSDYETFALNRLKESVLSTLTGESNAFEEDL
ncbi:unnamed protein product, partial [Medioppia subpectinata]